MGGALLKEKALEKSHNINKQLIKKRSFKNDRLAQWQLYKSNLLQNEYNDLKKRKHQKKTYQSFKPGTIVSIDLGVNIGFEFSGRHYAITLSRYDSNKEGTIMVVPLSSKDGKDRINLGRSLYINRIKEVRLKHEKNKELKRESDMLFKSLQSIIKYSKNKFIPSYFKYMIIKHLLLKEYKKHYHDIPKGEMNFTEIVESILISLEKKTEAIDFLLNEVEQELTELEEISKISYALPKQVRVVSKDRLTSKVVKSQSHTAIRVENIYLDKIRKIMRKEFS